MDEMLLPLQGDRQIHINTQGVLAPMLYASVP